MNERLLPSWNDTPRKRAILGFVRAVSEPGGPAYVPPAERVATFDNDGTLWCEKPLPAQAAFHAWRRAHGGAAAPDVVTERAFEREAAEFFATATHPDLHVPYPQTAYAPMRELVALLAAHDFQVFICSGGGISFVRVISERAYGIPRERVIGSGVTWECVVREDGTTELIRRPAHLSIDDGPGKPVHIQLHTGRRPLLVAGNSDGDKEMFLHARTGARPYLAVLLEHDDAAREYAYADHAEAVRQLGAGSPFDPERHRGWLGISMKDDFKTIFG